MGRVLDYGALKINAEYRSVESNGELVQLTNYEFEILYLLAKNPGRIFSKEQIYTQVWKEPYYGAEDNVMGIIRRIRKKIEPDSAKPLDRAFPREHPERRLGLRLLRRPPDG